MKLNGSKSVGLGAILLATTILSGVPVAAQTTGPATGAPPAAQGPTAPPPAASQPAATPQPSTAAQRLIRTLRVEGSQRIEPETALSYTKLRAGQPYTNEIVDQAISDLLESDLFADVTIAGVETGDLVIRVRENPIINRVIVEGNKRLKSDKITKEIKLAPRQVFSRTAVRQDVARIVELYRRQGRFGATVEPKMVALDQNRVDIVFEVAEGPKSKVRQINVIGNEKFSDDDLRGQMATKQSRLFRFFSSNTSYDQDRLAYDQQKLRQFYLSEGYADFRVTSAVAELTPDKQDFIITYVIEEGLRYKFGDVAVDSDIRDFNNDALAKSLPMKKGDWYNAKLIEDSIDQLSQSAGLFGYAFTEVNPEIQRDRETLTMGISFNIAQQQRSYVERIEINGNVQTQDKVIRREIRLNEGDAFNSFQVKRSQDRLNSLGYFQDKLEIKQTPGSSPDRVVLETTVEEKSTGELQLSAGFSSLERFIVQANITQRNFRGKGQELRAGVNYSTYSRSVELGFTEPYLFDKNIAVGVDVFRRDYNSFNFVNNERQTLYDQVSTGFQIRTGVPLTEYWSLSGRYGLSYEEVNLDDSLLTNGACDPRQVGRYLCDQLGNLVNSSVGFSLSYDSLNSRLRPSAGQNLTISGDFAGLGGDVKYLRGTVRGSKFFNVGSGFIFSLLGEGGYIHPLGESRGPGVDRVRIVDRFYLGEPQFRGFDIRGVGPRIQRRDFITDPNTGIQTLETARNQITDDALGGRAYYLGRAELEIPLGAGARELGLRPSIYVQAGSLFKIKEPLKTIPICGEDGATTGCFPVVNGVVQPLPGANLVTPSGQQVFNNTFIPAGQQNAATRQTLCERGFDPQGGLACVGSELNSPARGQDTPPFREDFLGNSAKPRLSVGIGVNWNSPFGPLRIDVARALLKQRGDDDKLITFNVGTQF